MRNGKPVVISLSSNDGLGLNLKNIGALITNQNIYFVPFGQDDKLKKPYSLVSDLSKAPETLSMALEHQQIQPILIAYGF